MYVIHLWLIRLEIYTRTYNIYKHLVSFESQELILKSSRLTILRNIRIERCIFISRSNF